ncbi:hypothetical protein JKF63_01243 [Porcisia hertigi]|uniref:Ribosomal RNA-processing protein 7 C-terminal domain-containing protein n=1 Tax=Porcisia hertigi TaxID=2761500 RepID=A0A836KZF4_9TRYP|nr:hypothetical protein JKF63_01243 [Porcisia hertigi]
MAAEDELRELLPKMRFNKEFKRKQKYKYKKRVEAREKELEIITGKKRLPGKQSAITKKGTKKNCTSTTGKCGSAATVTARAKQKQKTRVPKLKVAQAQTGQETLTKKKARELVQAKRRSKKTAAKKGPTLSSKSARSDGDTAAVAVSEPLREKQKSTRLTKVEVPTTAESASPFVEPNQALTPAERDRELLARAIRGDDVLGSDAATGAADGVLFIRQDPLLYPDHAFLDDYAERKHADVVSADDLLEKAHHFFKKLGKRERVLNKVAKEHISHLRAVNRRGGDKEGFRYVVPKSVKKVVRELLSAQKARDGEEDPEALIDPDQLESTFGGDGVAETSERPVRRSRRQRSRTYSDFYQFQVSKRWTRNAENFLKRSRPNKMLFEAKKHQRSIKKF